MDARAKPGMTWWCRSRGPTPSQMPRLLRLLPPIVVAPVEIGDRPLDDLVDARVIEAHHVDRVVEPARLRDVGPMVGVHAAMPAEQVMHAVRVELVVGELALARDETERLGPDARAPEALLRADRAIALAGAGGEVDVRLEADRAAMAAAVIGLEHGASLP